jgi:hypothetical protein
VQIQEAAGEAIPREPPQHASRSVVQYTTSAKWVLLTKTSNQAVQRRACEACQCRDSTVAGLASSAPPYLPGFAPQDPSSCGGKAGENSNHPWRGIAKKCLPCSRRSR